MINTNIVSFKKIDQYLYQIICLVVVAFFLLVNVFVNIFYNGDLFSLIIWFGFLWLIYIKDSRFLLKYCMVLIFHTFNIFGIYVCENFTIYLREIGVWSEPHGSLLLAVSSHIIFLYALWIFDLCFGEKLMVLLANAKKINSKIVSIIGYGFLIILTISFIHALISPAFMLGLDRFRYEAIYLQGFWNLLNRILKLSIPLIGMLWIYGLKRTAFVSLLLYLVYLFLIGNKFGPFLYVFYYLVPIFFVNTLTSTQIKKILASSCLIVFLLVGVVFFHNFITYGKNIQKNFSYLEQRIAQQGQLWWATYYKYQNDGFRTDELGDEFQTLFTLTLPNKNEWNHGIYKVMRNVTPQDIYDRKIASGSRYASATLASLYYYFKLPGLIIGNIVFAGMLCIIVSLYFGEMMAGNVFGSVLATSFMYRIYRCISQADYDVLFSFNSLVFLLLYFLMKIIIEKVSYK